MTAARGRRVSRPAVAGWCWRRAGSRSSRPKPSSARICPTPVLLSGVPSAHSRALISYTDRPSRAQQGHPGAVLGRGGPGAGLAGRREQLQPPGADVAQQAGHAQTRVAARRRIAASAATIRRWLARDALKPWQHRSWISVRDPDFAARAAVVLDLYAGIWDGRALGPGDYVICADEKTSIQARCRCHPTLPPGKARAMRIEHDYDRRGALAYLAAWDVHRGQVTGRCEDTTGIAPFARLVAQVMTTEPYASAKRVFWIVDNGSSHRGQASIDRMAAAWPNAVAVHLPVHASWLDQTEIFFSVIQRKVLTPNDFTDLDQIRDRLAAFETRYNAIARPFDWKFTRTDLSDLLLRIDAHVKAETHALAA